jgi:VIT1/CCC1 family predicted Fe2+/Mn2+ transporter
MPPKEQHRTQRTGWLRASVLGANDGVMSTASLLLGVAAAHTARSGIMIAGVSGLVAGALAMAAGEYVSVSSQAAIAHVLIQGEVGIGQELASLRKFDSGIAS